VVFEFLVFAIPLKAFFNAAALKKGFINTSTHQHISTSTHQHIITSTHQHISTSTHQHIKHNLSAAA
jgi:hypothetical protein